MRAMIRRFAVVTALAFTGVVYADPSYQVGQVIANAKDSAIDDQGDLLYTALPAIGNNFTVDLVHNGQTTAVATGRFTSQAVNNGFVIGEDSSISPAVPFISHNGSLSDLPLPAVPNLGATAAGVNASGTASGDTYLSNSGTFAGSIGCVWNGGSVTVLPSGSYSYADANEIANNGTIAGDVYANSNDLSTYQAVIWPAGASSYMSLGAGPGSTAVAISNNGNFIAGAYYGGGIFIFNQSTGKVTTIGAPSDINESGGFGTYPYSINNNGDVTLGCFTTDDTGYQCFLWNGSQFENLDLPGAIGNGTNIFMNDAFINDAGDIVGDAENPNLGSANSEVVELTPVPEPVGIGLFGVALPLLRRRRTR
jgi:hypothetical protein